MFLFNTGSCSITKDMFADLIRQYESNMYGLAMTILKNPDDSSDAVQNAVLIAYEQLDTLRNPDRFKSWILQILVNECRKMLRSKKNLTDDEGLEAVTAAPEDGITPETKIALNECVSSLDEPYRTVIRLFYYEEMSIKEISRITGNSSAAVRKQLQRGREMLKKQLKEEDE